MMGDQIDWMDRGEFALTEYLIRVVPQRELPDAVMDATAAALHPVLLAMLQPLTNGLLKGYDIDVQTPGKRNRLRSRCSCNGCVSGKECCGLHRYDGSWHSCCGRDKALLDI